MHVFRLCRQQEAVQPASLQQDKERHAARLLCDCCLKIETLASVYFLSIAPVRLDVQVAQDSHNQSRKQEPMHPAIPCLLPICLNSGVYHQNTPACPKRCLRIARSLNWSCGALLKLLVESQIRDTREILYLL